MKTPEILAPVGDWQMLRAAVHNGADAVYIGMPGFNARGRAATLEINELGAMIQYAHLYGVRVLLACNILIFQRELNDIKELLTEILPLSPDALIVQDIGLVRLIRSLAPEQTVHASTQMTVTNSLAIDITRDLSMRRYVLGREVSLTEMAKIKEEIRHLPDVELEVFVHGALCVSYSGQCLTSESLGGRSANRGQCAQSCRLPYSLIVDGEEVSLGEKKYLVSPKDLCSINEVPELLNIGIDSFKIEGRLKSPEYVASTVKAYSEKVHSLIESGAPTTSIPSPRTLEKVYSRGFFSGWMHGVNHQRLVDGRFGSHHGLEIGKVITLSERWIEVESIEAILPGDGLLFLIPGAKERSGASVYESTRVNSGSHSMVWRITFSNDFPVQSIKVGASVFINSSPSLEHELGKTFTDRSQLKRIPLKIQVEGHVGESLKITSTDPDGRSVELQSSVPLVPSKKSPLTESGITAELGALGGTIYSCNQWSIQIDTDLFLHNKELKYLRRTMVEQFNRIRRNRPPPVIANTIDLPPNKFQVGHEAYGATGLSRSQLTILVRQIEQIELIKDLDVDLVYLDFEFGKEYGKAADTIRGYGKRVGIATTRILKPGELGHLKVIERIAPDEILIRNLGAFSYFQESDIPLILDFSLNISNSLTAEWMKLKGAHTLTPSPDLNREQLLDLLAATPGVSWEVILHHYMPAFHMEHCVFAAFLSNGSSYRDCGRPCEKHRVGIKDPSGRLHPLKADAECRNTMFNGAPQSALRMLQEFRNHRVDRYRIEALFEDAKDLAHKIRIYRRIIDAELSPEEGITALNNASLGATEKIGVTDGQLYNIKRYADRKKDFVDLAHLDTHVDPGLQVVCTPQRTSTHSE
jgi:putative protease